MLLGTNITSGFTTLKLEGNSTDDWTSPSFTTDLDLYSNGNIGTKDIVGTHRYWRVVIEDTSVSDILIGWMYIGNRLQLPGISPSVILEYHTNTSVNFSVSQQSYANTGIDYFTSAFTFPLISDDVIKYGDKDLATREDILEFWYTNKGAKPIVMIIWDNDRNRFPPIVGLVAQNSMNFTMNNYQDGYSMDFNFVETK